MEIRLHEHLYFIYFFIIDIIRRVFKSLVYKLTGRHEVQRMCLRKLDICSKTFEIEDWFNRTKSRNIHQVTDKYYHSEVDSQLIKRDSLLGICDYESFKLSFIPSRMDKRIKSKNDDGSDFAFNQVELLDHIDSYINGPVVRSMHASKLCALDDTYDVIYREKRLFNTPPKNLIELKDAIYRILTYKQVQILVGHLASTKYDSNDPLHAVRLISLWNHMMSNEPIDYSANLVSNRWSRIGFQGDDPGTDFRGMGLLGLINLEYLARHRNRIAKNLMSNNVTPNYPFAIVGINLTYAIYKLIKNEHLKHFFYDDKYFKRFAKYNILFTINELYVELFIRFNCYWNQRSPASIMEFNSIFDDFNLIIQEDLKQLNFSIKFIYND